MEMSESQILPIALASVPTILTVLIGILINNSRLNDIDRRLNARIDDLRSHMDARFDDMRATWQAPAHRGVLGARLKHLEAR
jgi:hypothetical protein